MLYIPAPEGKRLVWYLSMEEYLAQHATEDVFFSWVVAPTVIFGRHQVMADEVNMPYCQAHGVQMYRRKSGGGCVYSDEGNLMLSYITPNTHSEQVFQWYLDTVADALKAMGFPAAKSDHNDVLIGDRKVSGNACYALPTGTIVHGTMLYNVDFAALQEAITPSHEKLAKHGVQSVRQRVVNLKDLDNANEGHPALRDIRALADYFAARLCDRTRELTAEEIRGIDLLEQTYLNPDFIKG
ncbi:MAG: biotin/lipoate A/B protein ligase family protein [Paludibacteraceae bacterium]